MTKADHHEPGPPVAAKIALAAIVGALYLPQSWYFLMGYSGSDYWLCWLWFFPGLPTFEPVARITLPRDTLTILATWTATWLLAATLLALSRRHRKRFWAGVAVACGWSCISAVSAYCVYRA